MFGTIKNVTKKYLKKEAKMNAKLGTSAIEKVKKVASNKAEKEAKIIASTTAKRSAESLSNLNVVKRANVPKVKSARTLTEMEQWTNSNLKRQAMNQAERDSTFFGKRRKVQRDARAVEKAEKVAEKAKEKLRYEKDGPLPKTKKLDYPPKPKKNIGERYGEWQEKSVYDKFFTEDEGSFVPYLNKGSAIGLAAGITAIATVPQVAKGNISVNNQMQLGSIEADMDGLPKQIGHSTSPSLMNAPEDYSMQQHVDTMGADGELAMALHNLRGESQFGS